MAADTLRRICLWILVWQREVATWKDAMLTERTIKKLPREKKLKLMQMK